MEIVEGTGAGRQQEIERPTQVGREPGLPITLEDPQVSRRHALIKPEGDALVVEDAGSRNGTFVNNDAIHAPRRLERGDTLRVGTTVLQVRTSEDVAAHPSAVRPVPAALAEAEPAAPLPPPKTSEAPAAYVPEDLAGDPAAQRDFDALARLVDTRVKRQTSIAAFAIIALAAMALLILFGAR